MATMTATPKISLVIPIYNEAENLLSLSTKIKEVLKDENYETIWIDDGSTDDSFTRLGKLAKKDKRIVLIQFRRNFGQTAALSAGFDQAGGEVIVTLDGDLQNDPKDIPKLIKKLDEGYDLVSGWRKDRQDELPRVILSKIANYLINKLTGLNLHDYGCTLKAYRSDLVKELNLYGEMHRFIPAVASQIGAKITEIPVRHHPRKYGKSKYGLDRTFRVILDVVLVKFLLTFQNKPLHLFGSLGLGLSSLGSIIFLWLSYQKFILGFSLSDRPLFIVAIFMILVGVQFVTIGILAEMLMRVYYESQGKKPYYIRHIVTATKQQVTSNK